MAKTQGTIQDLEFSLDINFRHLQYTQPCSVKNAKQNMDYPQETPERDRVSELKNERISLQKKTFTKWVNAFLEPSGHSVSDIFTDLSDGRMLIKLVENISKGKIGNVLKGKQRIHKIENVSRVLEYLKKFVKLESIGPEDVVDGKEELILGLLWTMILRFSISTVQEESGDGKSVKESLLLWCQRKTKGYAGVHIKNFTSSWKSGLAFNALIHVHRPDLFEYNCLQGKEHLKNLEHAFNVAEEKLGIKKLLDPQDIAVVRPDEKSIMTYVGLMYQYFAKLNKEKTGEKRLNKFVAELVELEKLKKNYKNMTTDILQWINTKGKELKNKLPADQHALYKEIELFKVFRNVHKPKKSSECVNIEVLLFNIQSQLQANKYKLFVPPAGLSINDIHNAWKYMEVAENERDKAIRNERMRHEKISQLLSKFHQKVKLREAWLSERMAILDSEQTTHDFRVDSITTSLKRQQGFEAEVRAQEVRFGNLDNIVEELKTQEYSDVKNIEDKTHQIREYWKKLVKKVSARKKTLASLQNAANVLRVMDELKTSLDQLHVPIQSKLVTTNVLDIDGFLQNNADNTFQLENKRVECESTQKKVDVLVHAKHQHATMMSLKMKDIKMLLEGMLKLGNERKKLLHSAKVFLTFKEKVEEVFTVLKEKKRLVMINRDVTDFLMGNKQINKHQQLILEIQNCENQCNSLTNEWDDITNKHVDPTGQQKTEYFDCIKSKMTEMKGELELLKECTNKKSHRLLMSSLLTQMNTSISDIEIWIKEKLTCLSAMKDPNDVNSIQLCLKRISEMKSEVTTFDTEMKLLEDQFGDVQKFSQNPLFLFERRAVVKIPHEEESGKKFHKGEIIFFKPENDDVWKVTKRNSSKEYHMRILFHQENLTNNNTGKLVVSPIKNKLCLLQTDKPYHEYVAISQELSARTVSKYRNCQESFKNVESMCKDTTENLLKTKDFFFLEETAANFFDWGNEILSYMNDMLGNLGSGNTDILQRQLRKVDKELGAHKILYLNCQNKCSELVRQKSPKENDINEMKVNLEKLMDVITQKRSILDEQYMAAHGMKLFQNETNKLLSWIAEKMKDVSRDFDFTNLNNSRRSNKSLQATKSEIKSIEQCVHDLNENTLLKESNPESQDLYNHLSEELRSLKTTTEQKLENVSSSFELQGFLADSEEVLISCKDKELLLKQHIQAETLAEVETFNLLLEEMSGELTVLVTDMGNLIQYGTTINDNGQQNASKAVCDLQNSLKKIQELWDSKKEGIQCQKFNLQTQNTLETCKQDANQVNELIDQLEVAKDELKISSTDLVKQCEKLHSKLNVNNSKISSVVKSLSLRKHDPDSLTEFTPLLNSVETLLKNNTTKLDYLNKEAIELASYEHFVAECSELGDRIMDKLPSVMTQEDSSSKRPISDLLKGNENLRMEMLSQEKLKMKLDEKASLFLEECHFASSDISDRLDVVDALWLDFNDKCQHKEEFLKKVSLKEKLRCRLADIKDWVSRERRKMTMDSYSGSLSASKDLLKKHEQFFVDLNNQILESKNLLKESTDLGDQDVLSMATDILLSVEEIEELSQRKLKSLENENNVQQFLIQSHMERLWIEEQVDLLDLIPDSENLTHALSIDRSLELTGMKLKNHLQCYSNAIQFGMRCLNNDVRNQAKIQTKMGELQTGWSELNEKFERQRKQRKHNFDILQYLAAAKQHFAVLDEKLVVALENYYGNDLSSSEMVLNRHARFSSEVSKYKTVLQQFVRKGNTIGGIDVKTAASDIKNRFKKLEKCCESRHKMLQSSHGLFLLYFEAENFKLTVQHLNGIVSSDYYGKNYEEVLQLFHSFATVPSEVKSLKRPLQKLRKLADNLVSQNHANSEDVKKLQEKAVNMYKRVKSKCEQRHKKLQKSLKYQKFLFNISSFASSFEEVNRRLQRHSENLLKFQTVSALKEELRLTNLLINELKTFQDQLNNSTFDLQEIAKDHPGKNIQKLSEHFNVVQDAYRTSLQRSEEIAEKYTLKILMLTFDEDVKHLKNWYHQTKQELPEIMQSFYDDQVQEGTTFSELARAQDLTTHVQLKRKQMELKEQKIDELKENVNNLDIPNEKKEIMQKQLSHLIEVKEEVRLQCENLLESLYSKLRLLSFSKEIQNVNKTLRSIDQSLDNHKEIMEKPHPEISNICRRHTELKNLLVVQKQRVQQISTGMASDTGTRRDDTLAQLQLKEDVISEKLSKQSKAIEIMVSKNKFLRLYDELNDWIKETVLSLSKPTCEDNIKFFEKQYRKLQSDITVYNEEYEKLKGMSSIEGGDGSFFTDRINEITGKWNTLTNLNRKRKVHIDERKAMRDFKKNVDLIKSHISDQVTILISKDCEVHSIEAGSNILRSLNIIGKEIGKIGQQVKTARDEVKELGNAYPAAKDEAVQLQKTFEGDFKRVQDLFKTTEDSANQSVHEQQFNDAYQDIETKVVETEKQLSEMKFNSDVKLGIKEMSKDFSNIEKNLVQLKTRKDKLRQMAQLLGNSSRDGCDAKLLILEQTFANLVEKAKKKKLLVEAQNRQNGFLQDVESTSTWASGALASVHNNKPLHYGEDVSRLLQKNAELRFETECKMKSMPKLSELGQNLIQDGQLSAMEVESRLKDLKHCFVSLNGALISNEKELCESISYQKYEEQMKQILDWLKEAFSKLNAWQHFSRQQQQQQNQQQQQLNSTVIQLSITKEGLNRLEKGFKEYNFVNEYVTTATAYHGEHKEDTLCEQIKNEIDVVRNKIEEVESNLSMRLEVELLCKETKESQLWMDQKANQIQEILLNLEDCTFTQLKQISRCDNEIKTFKRTLEGFKSRFDKIDVDSWGDGITPNWSMLEECYNNLLQQNAEAEQIVASKSENNSLSRELARIENMLVDKELFVLDVNFTEDRNLLEKMVQLLEDVGESVTTMKDSFGDVININAEITNENKTKIQRLSERFAAVKTLHENKESLTGDIYAYLSLCNEMNEEKIWLNTTTKKHVFENDSFGADSAECNKILREVKHTIHELTKHKSVSFTISGKLEHLANKTEDESFVRKIEQDTKSFNTIVHQFEKELDVRMKALVDAASIHEFLDDCDYLYARYEDLCELSQDISTGTNKETATKCLQRNQCHQGELSGYNDHFTVLEKKLENDVSSLSCFDFFEDKTVKKLDSLHTIRKEVASLTQIRRASLELSVRFYTFKSELVFLDHWIQEQIAHIKTDGIGKNTEECKALLRETEDFARNLIAKEERVGNFGILSHEIIERHPTSAKKILKNTSNIYEMWNDVKELLQSRLEVLEMACCEHMLNDNITDLVSRIEKLNEDFGAVKFDDVNNIDYERRKLNELKIEYESITESYNKINHERSKLNHEKDHMYATFTAPSIGKLEKVLGTLTEVVDNSSQALKETIGRKDFLDNSLRFGKWLDDTISAVQKLLHETKEEKLDTSSQHQKILNERDSCENFFLGFCSQLKHFKETNNKNSESEILKVWRPVESKWNLLTSILSEWHRNLIEMQDASKAVEELQAIEEWIENQELIFLSDGVSETSDEQLEEALKRHEQLDEYLFLQDEKVRQACLKVDLVDKNALNNESAIEQKTTSNKEDLKKENEKVGSEDSTKAETNSVEGVTSKSNNVDSTPFNNVREMAHEEKMSSRFKGDVLNSVISPDGTVHGSPTSKGLIGLLKKKNDTSQTLREPKKRVVFNTTHEFSDGCGNIENFYQLNDEIEDNNNQKVVDHDLIYDSDNDDDGDDDDDRDESFLGDRDPIADENNNDNLFTSDDDVDDGDFEMESPEDNPDDFLSPPNEFMEFKDDIFGI